jgi:hypothetical protein
LPRNKTILRGTEDDTLEIEGDLPDGTRVGVLFFAMRGLRFKGMPGPGFDYREALWRKREDDGAWLAVACDLDSALVRAFGRRIVRYPARKASFDGQWKVLTDRGELSASAHANDEHPDPVPPRRTIVREGDRAWEIPWEEIPGERSLAGVEILSDTLSEPTFGARVKWSSTGLVHRGRIHMCGFASEIRTATRHPR